MRKFNWRKGYKIYGYYLLGVLAGGGLAVEKPLSWIMALTGATFISYFMIKEARNG